MGFALPYYYHFVMTLINVLILYFCCQLLYNIAMNSEIIAYRDIKMKILQDDPLELNHYVTSDQARADDYAGREF